MGTNGVNVKRFEFHFLKRFIFDSGVNVNSQISQYKRSHRLTDETIDLDSAIYSGCVGGCGLGF